MAHSKIDNRQVNMFQSTERFAIDKPIRLIELFAGYGSQALALKYLGVPFEHWCISEWAINSIRAYKNLHYTDIHDRYEENLTNEEILQYLDGRISSDYDTPLTTEQIKKKPYREIYNQMKQTKNCGSIMLMSAKDLNIVDTDKYCYMMSYSFPCQDLSNCGKRAGMSKDVQTRSGLLWEVERLLKECDELPQVLIMENVPQVIGAANKADFDEWLSFLKSKGYTSKYQIYNTTEFKVPQNRERCFMVSVLGDYHIPMPKPMPLDLKLKDVLENNVDEKYYLRDKTIEMYMERTERMKAKGNGFAFKPREREREPSCGDNNDKSRRANGRQLYNRQFPFNADDEICRTIKAQYAQSSMANFQRQDTFGATGVALDCSYDIQVEREREREREQNQTSAKIDGQRQVQCESDRRTDSSSINSEYGQRICGRLSTIYGGVRLRQTMSYFKGVMPNISRTLTTKADTALVEMRIYADE